jgi:hypothetical protein
VRRILSGAFMGQCYRNNRVKSFLQ